MTDAPGVRHSDGAIFMSPDLAIAAITLAIRRRLQAAVNRLGDPVADVRTERPDTLTDTGTPFVNLYLYQLRLNPYLRNDDLQPRIVRTPAPSGAFATKAELVQDWRTPMRLSYLVSAYGDERQLLPQRLIAACVSALHRTPVIEGHAIVSAASALAAGATIDGMPEDVALLFNDQAFDDGFRLWSALKTTYALSVGYLADTAIVWSPSESMPVDLVETVDFHIRTTGFGPPATPPN